MQWEREADNIVTSSVPLSNVRSISDVERGKERNTYADLEFLKLAALVRQEAESTRQDSSDGSSGGLLCIKNDNGIEVSYQRCLVIGSFILNVLLVAVAISLLLLYLQLTAKYSQSAEQEELLRCNQSLLSGFLEEEKETNLLLRANLSSLLEDHIFLRDHTMSQLLHNQTRYLQAIETLGQRFQDVHMNYSSLQETFHNLTRSHLLVSRGSMLLQNCKDKAPDISSSVCPYCSPGWQFFEMSCYLLSPNTLSWPESLQWCRRQGGHLAVVDRAEKQYFIQGLVTRTSWIGLSDRDLEGDWRWVDGTPYDTAPKFWILNQPNNAGNEDCVTVSPGAGWNDDKCLKAYSSVCEHGAYQLRLNGAELSN
ncbi:asialoglycoprotein receptor 1-like [Pelodytes ibericus]